MGQAISSKVNVIASFDNNAFHEPRTPRGYQVFFDTEVTFSPQNKTYNSQLKTEYHILKQVITTLSNFITNEEEMSYLSVISLHYYDVTNEMFEDNCGFILRSSSKYYFQPDQRDLLEETVCKEMGISNKTENYKDYVERIESIQNKIQDLYGDKVVPFERQPRQLNDITGEVESIELRKRKETTTP